VLRDMEWVLREGIWSISQIRCCSATFAVALPNNTPA
jgi:hypothetical protein